MKRFITMFLILGLFLFFKIGLSAEEISAGDAGWMSYEEYFSENRPLPRSGEYRYSYSTEKGYIRPDKYSQVNGEYGNNSFVFKASMIGDTFAPTGEIIVKKKAGNKISEFSLGEGYYSPYGCCGYLYTLRGSELCRWNKATLEREIIYSGAYGEKVTVLETTDELVFFRVGAKIYRYYGPSRTLEMVLENDRVGFAYPTENNIIVIWLYSEEYVELITAAGWDFKDETVASRHPKDFETFYAWANEKYSLNLTVPTVEEQTAKYNDLTIGTFLKEIGFSDYPIIEGYDLKSQSFIDGYVIHGEFSIEFPTDVYHPSLEGIVPLPDAPSPWLGTEVKGIPEDLADEMALVPTGAFWGESVSEQTHAYTSLGNNQARVLVKALMAQKNIARPEKRELLTAEAQAGKERISAAEIKALCEVLYGPGSAEDLLSGDVIGDANAGDMFLKVSDDQYVYCWAPYAGSALNAEQYIRYLDSETDGDKLYIYTSYGYYRYNDGRESYSLYGDARTLRLLEFEATEAIMTGAVGDGTLEKLRNGELDEQLPVYKHTFVRNEDGSYYWTASSPVDSLNPADESPVGSLWVWLGAGTIFVFVIALVLFVISLKKGKNT